MRIQNLRIGDLIVVTNKRDSLYKCVGKIVLINNAVKAPHIEAYFNEHGQEFTSLLLLNAFEKIASDNSKKEYCDLNYFINLIEEKDIEELLKYFDSVSYSNQLIYLSGSFFKILSISGKYIDFDKVFNVHTPESGIVYRKYETTIDGKLITIILN